MSKPKLGVQLFSLREELADDLAGTIARVAEAGFAGVEPWNDLPIVPEQAAEVFKAHGLHVFSAHLPPLVGNDGAKWLAQARAYAVETIVLPFLPPERFATRDALRQTADLINQSARIAAQNGFGYAYHNHWWELADLDGAPALMRLRDLLDPSVAFEVDVYWVKLAGHDPAALLRDLGERAPLLHLKDGPADRPESPMLAAGTGALDFAPILAASQAAWGYVELDVCATDMLTAITESARYFSSSGLTQGQL